MNSDIVGDIFLKGSTEGHQEWPQWPLGGCCAPSLTCRPLQAADPLLGTGAGQSLSRKTSLGARFRGTVLLFPSSVQLEQHSHNSMPPVPSQGSVRSRGPKWQEPNAIRTQRRGSLWTPASARKAKLLPGLNGVLGSDGAHRLRRLKPGTRLRVPRLRSPVVTGSRRTPGARNGRLGKRRDGASSQNERRLWKFCEPLCPRTSVVAV